MFVLLEHDTRDEVARGRRPGTGEVHWDLLIETLGQEHLATWRLDRGATVLEEYAEHRVTTDLEGEHLRGRYEIVRRPGEPTLFRRAAEAALSALDD
jgi:hypothetical protein